MRKYVIYLLCMSFTLANDLEVTPFGLTAHDSKQSKPDLQWTGGSFEWPCPSTKALYKNSGKYISKNIIATRAQIAHDEVFLALPRYRSGSPATLVKTDLNKGSSYTSLKPFPCWSMQEEGNCQALQSVVDIFIDNNDILWVLDVGITQTLETPLRKCPPKIIAFNIKTGKVLKVIPLEEFTSEKSRLQYIIVDYSADNRCFLYISDASARAIITFDVQANRGFKVILPKAISHGSSKRDVLYLALVRQLSGQSVLYFTYLGGKHMFSLRTEYLRKGFSEGRVTDCGPKNSKIVIIGTDNGSALFFRKEGHSEILRWDSNTDFDESNFKVVFRSETCHLATHALADYKRSRMRVLESNFPDYIQNRVGCGAHQQLSIMQGCS